MEGRQREGKVKKRDSPFRALKHSLPPSALLSIFVLLCRRLRHGALSLLTLFLLHLLILQHLLPLLSFLHLLKAQLFISSSPLPRALLSSLLSHSLSLFLCVSLFLLIVLLHLASFEIRSPLSYEAGSFFLSLFRSLTRFFLFFLSSVFSVSLFSLPVNQTGRSAFPSTPSLRHRDLWTGVIARSFWSILRSS